MASLAIKNSRLERQELELALRSDISNLWQAYRNNLQLLNLERQNVITAKDNHEIAMERYIQGDISGFEVREAQKSLLDAEERILTAEYNTKLCEISLLQISGKVMHYLESGKLSSTILPIQTDFAPHLYNGRGVYCSPVLLQNDNSEKCRSNLPPMSRFPSIR